MLVKELLCKWNIKYLRDALIGPCTGDFIIFGCASGTGKSTISRLITNGAVDQNCPVVLYSLENEEGTFGSETALMAFLEETGIGMELREFALNDTDDKKRYEKFRRIACERELRRTASGQKILIVHEEVPDHVTGVSKWDIDSLAKSIESEVKAGYKLFIIDHLDTMAPTPQDELRLLPIIVNRLWALVAKYKICIVSFSQLNKSCSALCAGQNDLRGSLTKVFKCTHLITTGKHEYGYYQPPANYPGALPTYMRIAKARDSRTSCAVCYYNYGRYIDEYLPVICDGPGMFIDGMTRDKLQKWANKNK